MVTIVGVDQIYSSRDLLVMQADAKLAKKTVKQLVVQFDQQAYDEFNAGDMTAAASERLFRRVRPVMRQFSVPALTESSQGTMTSSQEDGARVGAHHHIFFPLKDMEVPGVPLQPQKCNRSVERRMKYCEANAMLEEAKAKAAGQLGRVLVRGCA